MSDNRTVWQEVLTNKKGQPASICIVRRDCTKQTELGEEPEQPSEIYPSHAFLEDH